MKLYWNAAAAAKSLQSCLTLCDPIDGNLPGSPIPGILPARTPEWVAISFSSAWKWKVKVKSLSRVWPSVTPWTAAFQAPPSMGFSRQEYWSGVPLPSPNTGIGWSKIQRLGSLLEKGEGGTQIHSKGRWTYEDGSRDWSHAAASQGMPKSNSYHPAVRRDIKKHTHTKGTVKFYIKMCRQIW